MAPVLSLCRQKTTCFPDSGKTGRLFYSDFGAFFSKDHLFLFNKKTGGLFSCANQSFFAIGTTCFSAFAKMGGLFLGVCSQVHICV